MKKHLLAVPFWIAALALVPAAPALASSDAEPNVKITKQEISEAIDEIQSYTADQRDAAVAKAEELIDAMDAKIEAQQEEFRMRWNSMSEATREEAREAMRALNQQRNALAEWLGGIKHSSEDAWDSIVDGFGDAYTDVADAWNDAVEELQD